MQGVFKYLLANYHILGILLVVVVIAIKLFVTTRHAKELLRQVKDSSKLEDIIARLKRIEKSVNEMSNNVKEPMEK